jgi:hypothetical protein
MHPTLLAVTAQASHASDNANYSVSPIYKALVLP